MAASKKIAKVSEASAPAIDSKTVPVSDQSVSSEQPAAAPAKSGKPNAKARMMTKLVAVKKSKNKPATPKSIRGHVRPEPYGG